jgi:large subunit ribosomal protein L20
MRVARGVKAHRRRKRILKIASGFRGRSKNTIRQATQRAEKAMVYTYRDRRARKRVFRSLWITRISASATQYGISYSDFIAGLKAANIQLDRKILADFGVNNPEVFKAVAEVAKAKAPIASARK